MAYIQCDFYSTSLSKGTNVNIYMPDDASVDELSVLYLLHGYTGDAYGYALYTTLIQYATEYNVAIIMPHLDNSYYCNYETVSAGWQYFDYLTIELPKIIKNYFNISSKRENTFIAGLSMGGFGAMKAGLNFPEVYSHIGSFSGVSVLDSARVKMREDNVIEAILGKNYVIGKGSSNDLYSKAVEVSKLENKPSIYLSCGLQDFLYEENLAFHNHLSKLGFDYTSVFEDGVHDYVFWDRHLKAFFNTLPLTKIN